MALNGSQISPDAMMALNPQSEPMQQGQAQPQQPKFSPLSNSISQWLIDAYVLGGTIGDVGRAGLTHANNHVTAAMNALGNKDGEAARAAALEWKETAQQVIEYNKARIEDYMRVWQGSESLEQKLATIKGKALGRYQDMIVADMADQKNFTALGRYFDALTQMQTKAEKSTGALAQQVDALDKKHAAPSGDTGIPDMGGTKPRTPMGQDIDRLNPQMAGAEHRGGEDDMELPPIDKYRKQ